MRFRLSFPSLCFLLAASLFSSCSGLETMKLRLSSTRLDAALKRKDLAADTRKLLELSRDIASFSAERYGLAKEASALRYLPGKSDALAWRLTVAGPHSIDSPRTVFYRDRAEAEKEARVAEKKGQSAFIEPLDSLGYLGLHPSPLTDAQASWPYAKLVEWINSELFSAACARSRDQAVRDHFPTFAAEIATKEYLESKLTSASPILGSYISEKRDDRAFAALLPDYRSRIGDLYAQRPLPPDWSSTRDFLSRTWLQDYRDKYPSRFLTNKYRDFGRSPVSDAEIAAWSFPSAAWGEWEKKYREAGENIGPVVEQVLGR